MRVKRPAQLEKERLEKIITRGIALINKDQPRPVRGEKICET